MADVVKAHNGDPHAHDDRCQGVIVVLNELTWRHVMSWEWLHCEECPDPKLARFCGRPDALRSHRLDVLVSVRLLCLVPRQDSFLYLEMALLIDMIGLWIAVARKCDM